MLFALVQRCCKRAIGHICNCARGSGSVTGNWYSFLQFSKKDAGIYEVILKDDRGKDKSILKLVEGGKSAMLKMCSPVP